MRIMKIPYILLLPLYMVAIATAFYLVGVVFAHHHRFFATDPKMQVNEALLTPSPIFGSPTPVPSTPLPENHISASWALTPYPSSVKFFIENPTLANPAKTPTASINGGANADCNRGLVSRNYGIGLGRGKRVC